MDFMVLFACILVFSYLILYIRGRVYLREGYISSETSAYQAYGQVP
jgi:hypothetical protein